MIGVVTTLFGVFIAVLGQNLIVPNALPGAIKHFPKMRGAAGAVYGSGQMVGTFASSAIIASFSSFGVLTLSVAYILLGVLGCTAFAMILFPLGRV